MRKNQIVFWAGIAFIVVCVSVALASCEHGALIPIDPDVDICAQEGVEDCCIDCEVCEDCEVCVVCAPPTTVYLCKERVKVCPKSFCYKWDGGCCHYETKWVGCEGPVRR